MSEQQLYQPNLWRGSGERGRRERGEGEEREKGEGKERGI